MLFFVGIDVALPQNQGNQQGASIGGTAVQLPTLGVAIDGDGLLTMQALEDPGGRLRRERIEAARAVIPRNAARPSQSRKISLRRLAHAIERSLTAGKPLSEEIRCLVGLRRINHIFLYPEEHDIVIAGTAGGWFDDGTGRIVGIDDNLSVVMLDDLITALRALGPQTNENRVVLCSIDPTPTGLERFRGFHRSMPTHFRPDERAAIAERLTAEAQQRLGPATVRVQGVPDDSHVAQVMVESDYRMKLIAVGLEPPPVEMTTFAAAIDGPIRDMQQWWLTPNYRWICEDRQGESLEMQGEGVRLLTDRMSIGPDGSLQQTKTRPSKAARLYSESFTKMFPKIAVASPVFGQLRTVVDLLVGAAWLRRHQAWDRVGWDGGILFDEQSLTTESYPVPMHVQTVANAIFKGEMLVVPAGGGFSINPAIALEEANVTIDKAGDLTTQRKSIRLPENDSTWWWD